MIQPVNSHVRSIEPDILTPRIHRGFRITFPLDKQSDSCRALAYRQSQTIVVNIGNIFLVIVYYPNNKAALRLSCES